MAGAVVDDDFDVLFARFISMSPSELGNSIFRVHCECLNRVLSHRYAL